MINDHQRIPRAPALLDDRSRAVKLTNKEIFQYVVLSSLQRDFTALTGKKEEKILFQTVNNSQQGQSSLREEKRAVPVASVPHLGVLSILRSPVVKSIPSKVGIRVRSLVGELSLCATTREKPLCRSKDPAQRLECLQKLLG